MRLEPFFSYYGSKWRLSPRYPDPLCQTIIEPFAGSACYSLFHGWKNSNQHVLFGCQKVKLFDVNEKICILWKYLIEAKESEILELPLLKPNQRIPQDLPLGAQYLIGFWCSKAATSPQKKMAATARTDLGHWSENIRNRVANQLKYIRHWTIEERCYTEIPNQEATWFVDPPYLVGGKKYTYSQIDYDFLGEWCQSRLGQIIVCENEAASWLPFKYLHTTKGLKNNTVEKYYSRK